MATFSFRLQLLETSFKLLSIGMRKSSFQLITDLPLTSFRLYLFIIFLGRFTLAYVNKVQYCPTFLRRQPVDTTSSHIA